MQRLGQHRYPFDLMNPSNTVHFIVVSHLVPRNSVANCRNWLFLFHPVDNQSECLAHTALVFKTPSAQAGTGRFGAESPAVLRNPPSNLEIYLCKHRNIYSSESLEFNEGISDFELEWASGIMTDVCLWIWRLVLI